MGPQTGDLAFLGKPSLQACQMAVDDFNNKNGGVNGVKVTLVAEDDQGKPDQAQNLAKAITSDPTFLGVVGPMTSGAVLAIAPTLDAAGVGFVSQSASNVKITESGWKVAHRVVARDDEQGSADATFLAGAPVNAKNVYVVDSREPYSIGVADEFEKTAKSLGITTERDGIDMGGKDYSAIVTKVKAANPDMMFFPNQGPECPLIEQEMQKQGVKFKLMSTDGCHDKDQFITKAQGAANGNFVSDIGATYDSTDAGKAWGAQFKQRFNADPTVFTSYAYDATNVILNAIAAAAKTKGGLNLTPADVNTAIGATSGYKGLLGDISFNSKGDITAPVVSIFQVANNDFTLLKTIQAQAPSSSTAASAAGSAAAKPSASVAVGTSAGASTAASAGSAAPKPSAS
ncbi:MAG TPA: branched-chain amino acid ABC transporter substrate-binding protein [Chloroflexota bacterium]|jgi:branched-chain amino acid transport system substrate-binding protein|nr:branched-chain amino acid ABC transporter substrate-binding protein [Chloroflexota bacterium]